MAAENAVSVQQQKQQEPDELPELLYAVEREVFLLALEMEEILHRSTSRYELYPRLSAALRGFWHAKSIVVKHVTTRWPELDSFREHSLKCKLRESLLDELDRCPWKSQQMRSESWQLAFQKLRGEIELEIRHNREVFLPEFTVRCQREVSVELGTAFKKALKESDGVKTIESVDA